MNNYFQNSRLRALHHWLYETGRVLLYNDNELLAREYVANNFECKWQIRNEILHEGTNKKDKHISIFCSLNNWSSHITDMLGDMRFDLVPMVENPIREEEVNDKGEKIEYDIFEYELLFRHYSRFMLVVSELMVDFGDIAKFIDKSNTSKIFESEEHISYSSLRGFINNVFKHKTRNLHKCNHHIPILFEDGNIYDQKFENNDEQYYIKIDCTHEYDLKEVEYILVVPKLIEVIKLMIFCYKKIDNLMTDKNINYIAADYGDKY